MKIFPSLVVPRCATVLSLVACSVSFACPGRAAGLSEQNASRLLQTELSTKATLADANGEQLAGAVGRATLAHRSEATVILRAALTRGFTKSHRGETMMSCAWAKRIFSVSVAAAPSQASALLDVATELYPDCAAELTDALHDYDRLDYDYKDGKDSKDAGGSSHRGNPAGTSEVPANANDPSHAGDPFAAGNANNGDFNGLGYGDPADGGGFGVGFGPGYPGSPGFTGSSPSGGFALPPAAPVVVTSVVNG